MSEDKESFEYIETFIFGINYFAKGKLGHQYTEVRALDRDQAELKFKEQHPEDIFVHAFQVKESRLK